VKVFARPSVAVLSTGDELVGIEQSPRGSQIRNSNNVMLVALLRRLGCEVRDLGTVNDDPEKIRAAMSDGLARADVLFVTGGMSMGQYDWCPKVMREMGADLRITKLKIKPGKPFVFGEIAAASLAVSQTGARPVAKPQASRESAGQVRYIFGLPGNPVSGFVCTLRLCSRLLTRIAGGEPCEKWLTGTLDAPLAAYGPREFYQPARYNAGRVQALAWKGSADLYTLAAADVLLVRAENEPALPAGATVKVLEIPT
jgi:molybdopterin molybdotransferase